MKFLPPLIVIVIVTLIAWPIAQSLTASAHKIAAAVPASAQR